MDQELKSFFLEGGSIIIMCILGACFQNFKNVLKILGVKDVHSPNRSLSVSHR